MSANVIQITLPQPRRRLGPTPAVITAHQVLRGRSGPLLELRLSLRLADVPQDQRRALAALLRSGDLLTLTLTGNSRSGGEGVRGRGGG